MDAKLTLKLNENVIRRAKQYASRQNMSLSRLIENYLDSLTGTQKDEFEISPFVKSISSGKPSFGNDDKKLRKEYMEHLAEKHQ